MLLALLGGLPGMAVSAAMAQEITWIRQFGGSGEDHALGVAMDGAGGIYIVGHVTGALPGQIPIGDADAFVRKYDVNGNLVWTRQFGTPASDNAAGIAAAATAVYVAGNVCDGALPGQKSAGACDAFVRKYDLHGDVVWTRQFGTSDDDGANAVAVDETGDVLIVGPTSGVLPGQTSAGPWDAYVRKYDPEGNVLWTRQFGTTAPDNVNTVAVGPAGQVIVAGSIFGGGALPGQAPAETFDSFIRVYTANGVELWTHQFGPWGGIWDVGVDANGSIYAVGGVEGELPGQSRSGVEDTYLRKYDPNGTEQWTRQFGNAGGAQPQFGLAMDSSGDILVGGVTGGVFAGQIAVGDQDFFLRKYDPSGNVLLTRQFGTTGFDGRDIVCGCTPSGGMVVDASGAMYMAAFTRGSFAGQVAAGGDDAFVLKLSQVDTRAPTTSASLGPQPNAAGWNRTNVTVTLTATDQAVGSGVQSITFSAIGAHPFARTLVSGSRASVPITAEGTTSLSYFARDQAGNQERPSTLVVRIDKTTPVVTFTGNRGSYTVDQSVTIDCIARDPRASNGAVGSGVASTTCRTVSGLAYNFNLGPNELTATATDVAGNTGSGSTAFSVRVTFASLCALSRHLVSNQALADGMCTVLAAAQATEHAGVPQGKAAELRAYQGLVQEAHRVGALTAEHAAVLSRLAGVL